MKTLNIKDPEAHRLATVIAKQTGESLTHIVTEALRQRLEAIEQDQRKASIEELRGIAERIAAATRGPYIDHAELLYDEYGLPK